MLVASCGFGRRFPGLALSHRIQQGNYILAEMVGQLKPGMSKEQVRLTLGTAAAQLRVVHSDRWD